MHCPVDCKYCMANRIDIRSKFWEDVNNRIGLNKSCLFINRLPNDPPVAEMGFPWHLMDGEYLGFQGITDCFWQPYFNDLEFIIDKVNNSKIRRLVLTTKLPVSINLLSLLKTCKKLLVVYSLTGLDSLENTTTSSRINSMELLLKEGIDVFPIIHPYIHEVSDLSFISQLEKLGLKYISWKGFRFNPNNMPDLIKLIPPHLLNVYTKNEEEILLGEDYLKELTSKHNLTYIDLKSYIRKNRPIDGVSVEQATQDVNSLKELVCLSTSEKDSNLLYDYVIKRRTEKKS